MALELKNISYKNIIKNINYSFDDGKVYAVLSSSEKEKEILGKIISGVIDNYEGKVKSTARIGYTYSNPQEMFICDTVNEELQLCLKSSNYTEETKNKKISFALKMLGLNEDIKNVNPNNISSGEKKILSIAISLITNPKVLVLEDPELYLDDYHKKSLIKIIKKIAKRYNKIVIIITSDVMFSYETCDNYILLNKGKIIKEACKKELINIDNELEISSLKTPEIINFINCAIKKNMCLNKTYDIKELMKDVYRNVK